LKDSAPRPRLTPVLAFTGCYVALATAGARIIGSRELPMYLGVIEHRLGPGGEFRRVADRRGVDPPGRNFGFPKGFRSD
jgi:hypothetical protein